MGKSKSPFLPKLAFQLFPARIILSAVMVSMSLMVIIQGEPVADSLFVPAYLAFGLFPWYSMLACGVILLLSAWIKAKHVKRVYFDNL